MTNEEVFKNYGTEKWVIEQNLSFLIQDYCEKAKMEPPINPVAFVKEFVQKKTLINTKYAEMSAIDTAEKNVVAEQESDEILIE